MKITTRIETDGLPVNWAVYAALRQQKGSQSDVARALGVSVTALSRRETNKTRVTPEHMLALLTLPDYRKPDGKQLLLSDVVPTEGGVL